MELRPNQTAPVYLALEFFKKPHEPAIIVAPTAFGKSVVIAKIAEQQDRVLIIQPSKELLEQNYQKFVMLGGYAAIYSASMGQKRVDKVTYATIGSIYKHGAYFKEMGFTKIIIDEAHLYPRNRDSMLGEFLAASGISWVLGLTATPLKLQTNMSREGKPFSQLKMLTSRSKHGQFYKNILYVAQIQEMVEMGYWSKLMYEQYDMDTTGLVYNSSRSDYTEDSMHKVYEGNNTHEKIMHKFSVMTDRRSIIVFVPCVIDAQKLASQTPNATCVYAEMNPKDRELAITGFKKGAIRVIYNVNILATGFDHTKVDGIITARPTASLGMYYQQIGRGTRIDPEKKDCLVVDFSGNVKKFGKLENLVYRKENNTWGLYGEKGVLLTGVPLHEIGKPPANPLTMNMPFGQYRGQKLKFIPLSYRFWLLRTIKFGASNKNLKEGLMATLSEQEKAQIIPQMK